MNGFYKARYAKAEEIAFDLEDLMEVVIVGSVAYNPDAVTHTSDLDLVGVLDMQRTNFEELYEELGLDLEPDKVNHALSGGINSVSIVWKDPFEIGLHLWDYSAFDNVLNLRGPNYVFKPTGFDKFKSTAEVESMYDLFGNKFQVIKQSREVEGGKILEFFPLKTTERDFYSGIQLNNLLLNPKVLTSSKVVIQERINGCKVKLRELLTKLYVSSSECNLYNALPPKIKDKINDELKEELISFF
jgi:hypothetical protein